MEKALFITNIILVVFTGIYVALTYKLTRESTKNNNINVDYYREQLRLSCMPIITVFIPDQEDSRNVSINIENIGNLPAYDLDIWFVSAVHNDDHPKSKLARLSKDKEHKRYLKLINKNSLADGEFYGLIDYGAYSVLHGNYMIKLNSVFAFEPYSLYLLLQYKDHIGNNYYQLYSLSHSENFDRLIIDNIKPSTLKTHPRFDLNDIRLDESERKIEKGKSKNIPKDVEYLYELVRAGINLGLLQNGNVERVESKWKIERLKNNYC